jgi:hypothetical protein
MIGPVGAHPLGIGAPPFVEIFAIGLLYLSAAALVYRLVRRNAGDDGTQF